MIIMAWVACWVGFRRVPPAKHALLYHHRSLALLKRGGGVGGVWGCCFECCFESLPPPKPILIQMIIMQASKPATFRQALPPVQNVPGVLTLPPFSPNTFTYRPARSCPVCRPEGEDCQSSAQPAAAAPAPSCSSPPRLHHRQAQLSRRIDR